MTAMDRAMKIHVMINMAFTVSIVAAIALRVCHHYTDPPPSTLYSLEIVTFFSLGFSFLFFLYAFVLHSRWFFGDLACYCNFVLQSATFLWALVHLTLYIFFTWRINLVVPLENWSKKWFFSMKHLVLVLGIANMFLVFPSISGRVVYDKGPPNCIVVVHVLPGAITFSFLFIVYTVSLCFFIRPIRKVLKEIESETLRITAARASFWSTSVIVVEFVLFTTIMALNSFSDWNGGDRNWTRHVQAELTAMDITLISWSLVMVLRPYKNSDPKAGGNVPRYAAEKKEQTTPPPKKQSSRRGRSKSVRMKDVWRFDNGKLSVADNPSMTCIDLAPFISESDRKRMSVAGGKQKDVHFYVNSSLHSFLTVMCAEQAEGPNRPSRPTTEHVRRDEKPTTVD